MPDKCFVPNCTSNYDSTHTYVSVFSFPKDEELKKTWIKCIHRESFNPTKHSVVCIKHFSESSVITIDKITRNDGSVLEVPRKKPALIKNAVPSIFPNQPSYMTKKSPKRLRSNMFIMADHFDQVNINNTMLLANTFSVKEEQCQEESFVEDKLFISETGITTDNAELQDPIWYGKIKQYEESTCLDNIKTELTSFQVTGGQRDNLTIEGGSNDDIKTEFDNGLLYCERCEAYYKDYCIECGMLVNILNKYASKNTDGGAPEDIPNDILEIQDCFGQTGIYALRIIPAGVKFGPFTGLSASEYLWEMKGEKLVLDKNKSKSLNWMQYINPTRNICDGNLHVFQTEDNMYYQSTCQIQAGEELLVYFGEEYKSSPNKIVIVDSVTIKEDIVMNVYACTFCCFGFSSKLHLAKHKTVCVVDAAGKFSIEELTQCPFCKIQIDRKEYLEHHMSFCCKRNARKGILPTPPQAKQATTALNERKRCLPPIYKCEQCKYKTKYQADLKKHSKQHCEVKVYNCGLCNRRFKTKESLRLHVENTHAYVEGKHDREHSTTDYRNTHIKVEQSSSRDQKKMFKCSLCVFQAKYKQSLSRHVESKHLNQIDYKSRHVESKHLNQIDYKCESCEYRAGSKRYFEMHIKSKHLKQFDYKCDSCEFGTNRKNRLEEHIKTKHLNKFDYKCDLCEYETSSKRYFEIHMKSKHLKEFDYQCDSCEFRTNRKTDLNRHVKTKHLKKLDYKCDKCEFGTNNRHSLEEHVKTKHLKKFDYDCDKCEFRTNNKSHLEVHIKTKHLKKFDYKCDLCEFKTNRKNRLDEHIKTKHLNEFDYKCDLCEYGTSSKRYFEIHMKSKHLKEFDYKCDLCEYGTSSKRYFEIHMKSKHLKEFDYQCDSCEFRTNRKTDLNRHVKTKHLKKFDYKCDKCEFGTNNRHYLEEHVKTKHLKKFDYDCDKCEYRTNNKSHLEVHMKRKHF